MLCIAVAPESRQLGRVDLFNASMLADIIELRLDRLHKEPDIKEMLEGVSKPILISCRRKSDGGAWEGSEDERMTLLRQGILAGPAYVELELDVADKVPRFGKTQRVVSYTQMQKPLSGLEPILEQAAKAKADVVKLVGPTPTLDAAWPLLATVTKKRTLPVVGMGLGRPGTTFSLLGRRYGAPWIYAALEKGLEAYEGQSTVTELDEVYHWKAINTQTKFIAVTGFDECATLRVKVLNAGFAHHQMNTRCLPLELGISEKIGQMLDALHCPVIVGNPRMGERMLNLASDIEEPARVAQYSDLVVKQKDSWHALNTLWRATLRSIETALGAKTAEDRPLDKRNVFVIGAGGPAKGVAYGIQKRKGMISITAADNSEAQMAASQFGARFVPIANMYDTLCDVVVITEAYSMDEGDAALGVRLNPSFLRPHMLVTDLSRLPLETNLVREARLRGCKLLDPRAVFCEHMQSVFKTISGKELPLDVAMGALGEPQVG